MYMICAALVTVTEYVDWERMLLWSSSRMQYIYRQVQASRPHGDSPTGGSCLCLNNYKVHERSHIGVGRLKWDLKASCTLTIPSSNRPDGATISKLVRLAVEVFHTM